MDDKHDITEVSRFDKTKLKKTETQEKNTLQMLKGNSPFPRPTVCQLSVLLAAEEHHMQIAPGKQRAKFRLL
uniref:Uncharacterized protein n=1 Tax=Oryzias latipes TaxID=8090 RepID=A0A3P9KH31_ORYLA